MLNCPTPCSTLFNHLKLQRQRPRFFRPKAKHTEYLPPNIQNTFGWETILSILTFPTLQPLFKKSWVRSRKTCRKKKKTPTWFKGLNFLGEISIKIVTAEGCPRPKPKPTRKRKGSLANKFSRFIRCLCLLVVFGKKWTASAIQLIFS